MDLKNLPKSSTRRILSKPLRDLSINVSDSPLHKPGVSYVSKKPLLTPKVPLTAPSTPRTSSIPACKTPKGVSSKIKSPSNYVFETHNHSTKFALTPKKSESKAKTPSSTPRGSTSVRQKEHLLNTFQAIKIAKVLRHPTDEELSSKELRLSRPKGYERKKTVIFDLDETLVHCLSSPELGQIEIDIELPNGTPTRVGINIRPYVKEMLTAVSKEFEVIVFTASHKCYADKVIDLIDPSRTLVHHRLYRNNCIQIDGIFVKDLRIFTDRAIKDIVIVDNAAYSFAFQILNGIPIISWYNNLEDRELFKLIEYLRVLSRVDDIRAVNQFTFHLDSFYEDFIKDFKTRSDKENSGGN
jgi:CTD small phosphatase-like protein 2